MVRSQEYRQPSWEREKGFDHEEQEWMGRENFGLFPSIRLQHYNTDRRILFTRDRWKNGFCAWTRCSPPAWHSDRRKRMSSCSASGERELYAIDLNGSERRSVVKVVVGWWQGGSLSAGVNYLRSLGPDAINLPRNFVIAAAPGSCPW
jgi:hypothetical protein